MKHTQHYGLLIVLFSLIIAIALGIHFFKSRITILPTFARNITGALESTCAIIKPDAVLAGYTGDIIKLIEFNKFIIKNMIKMQLSIDQAQQFYAVHKDKPFYQELVAYMVSGPIIVLELEHSDAIAAWRDLMGTTNPIQAHMGTLRYMFGSDITHNAVHGSDSSEASQQELTFFFGKKTC